MEFFDLHLDLKCGWRSALDLKGRWSSLICIWAWNVYDGFWFMFGFENMDGNFWSTFLIFLHNFLINRPSAKVFKIYLTFWRCLKYYGFLIYLNYHIICLNFVVFGILMSVLFNHFEVTNVVRLSFDILPTLRWCIVEQF